MLVLHLRSGAARVPMEVGPDGGHGFHAVLRGLEDFEHEGCRAAEFFRKRLSDSQPGIRRAEAVAASGKLVAKSIAQLFPNRRRQIQALARAVSSPIPIVIAVLHAPARRSIQCW